MALSLGVGVVDVAMGVFSSLSVMVEVEGLREKPDRGPRWVSFSSSCGTVVSDSPLAGDLIYLQVDIYVGIAARSCFKAFGKKG